MQRQARFPPEGFTVSGLAGVSILLRLLAESLRPDPIGVHGSPRPDAAPRLLLVF